MRNSIILGTISGGIIGVISMLSLVLVYVTSNGLTYALYGRLSYELSHGLLNKRLSYVLNFGLSHGLASALRRGPLIGLFGGLLAFMSMGGLAVWRHYVIRFLLWRTHTSPRLASRFLDDATARFLLRRVGGGYSFAHRLLLDHLADEQTGTTSLEKNSPLPPE